MENVYNFLNSASFLYVLLLLPTLIIFWRKFQRQEVKKVSDLSWRNRIKKPRSWPSCLSRFLLVLAVFALISAIFLPQPKSDFTKEKIWGREILFVMDVSGSMGIMSFDENENVSGRITSKEELAQALMVNIQAARKNDFFGEIFFASEASWVRFFSNDEKQIFSVFTDGTTSILSGGTNTHLGLLEAKEIFGKYSPGSPKTVIFLTDLDDMPDQTLGVLIPMLKEEFVVIAVAIGPEPRYQGSYSRSLRSAVKDMFKSDQLQNLHYFELISEDDLAKIEPAVNSILDKIPKHQFERTVVPEEPAKQIPREFVFAGIGLLFMWVVLNFLWPKIP